MEITLHESEKKTLFSIYFLIIILPFILLYWMLPFLSDLTLGADYQLFSINEQIELLFSIKTGSFPLYVPGYSFGHSSSALTLGQIYHPISHIASLLPGYWNGKALEWNTFLRLLSLGLTHLALFAFLRRLRLNMLFSFLLSLITVYNLRMLEAFRYGASLEAFTGHLLLCTAIGWYFISPSKWLGPLSIIVMTYLLVCSGHPPMMFYGLLGACLFTLILPFFMASIFPDKIFNIKNALRFWTKAGIFICLGILLSAAYIVPFYFEFVNTNIEYAKSDGLINVDAPETFVGALNNFFIPFDADLLGSFGGSSLILVALFLPLLRFFRVKIPPSIWAIWGILLYALLYILGPSTPIYRWAWEYFPFVSSVGGVGRIAMIVPSILMMLLVWIINAESFSVRLKGSSVTLTPCTFLALIALILIPIYLFPVFLLKPSVGYFTPHFIRKIPFWIEFVSVLLGMVSLVSLIFYGLYSRWSRVLGIFLCLMILLQIGTIMKYGIFIEKKYNKPTFQQMEVEKKEKLTFHFHQNPGLFHAVVLNHLSRSFVEPFLGKIYTQIIPVSSQDEAYKKMDHERLPQQVFVEGYDSGKAKLLTEKSKYLQEGSVNLIYSSFNRLQFRVVSPTPAIFGMAYPFTGHWSAWVNSKKVHVYRANGIAHAVEIPEGESLVEFRYWSESFFWGVLVSCLTFAGIGLFVCFRGLKGLTGITGAVIVLIISAGGFILWYNSLYNGDNLKTEYSWTYTPPQSSPNLAYGKKTSGFFLSSAFLHFHSSNAVDGETEPGSGFPLKPADDTALIVDLNQNDEIKTIVIYGKVNSQPLISLSQEGNHWHEIASVNAEWHYTNPLRINLKKSQLAHFVKIKPSISDLEIDEVEIY